VEGSVKSNVANHLAHHYLTQQSKPQTVWTALFIHGEYVSLSQDIVHSKRFTWFQKSN